MSRRSHLSHDGEYGRILAPLGAEEDEALADEADDEVFEGEVDIGDEAEEFEQDVEEAREARGRRAPRGPTQGVKEKRRTERGETRVKKRGSSWRPEWF